MILPTKHLNANRALITIASEILGLIDKRSTVSSLWSDLSEFYDIQLRKEDVSYDWFVLALDLLYILGVIEMDGLYINRKDADVA
jgi:hypothetical protein